MTRAMHVRESPPFTALGRPLTSQRRPKTSPSTYLPDSRARSAAVASPGRWRGGLRRGRAIQARAAPDRPARRGVLPRPRRPPARVPLPSSRTAPLRRIPGGFPGAPFPVCGVVCRRVPGVANRRSGHDHAGFSHVKLPRPRARCTESALVSQEQFAGYRSEPACWLSGYLRRGRCSALTRPAES